MKETIYFASDHAGFELKNELREFVAQTLGYEVVDCGADTFDPEDDFTDFIAKAAREVSAKPLQAKAIILGGSGQGEAMLANRFHDVRATVYYGGPTEIITLSREHNDANVLSLGARFLNTQTAKDAVSLWLSTPHTVVEKYERRIAETEVFGAQVHPQLPVTVVPSLPARSFEELQTLANALAGTAQGLQIDIVDNEFVPNVSWPFIEQNPKQALSQLSEFTNAFEVEIDCMCMNPELYLDAFVQAGVKRVVVHMGSTSEYAYCIAHARKHGYRIGFAVRNNTPLEDLYPYRSDIDFVQVMGIKNIGVQGEPFDEDTLDTVAQLRALEPSMEIAVDGAVNKQTMPSLLQSGVTRFAPGSAITRATNQKEAYLELSALVGVVG